MQALREWAFSLCSAMAICGIALQLMPKSNLEGIFKLVASVFILSVMLSPIIIQIPHERLLLEEYSSLEAGEKAENLMRVVDSQTQAAAKSRAEKIIADKLRQMGIKYHSITININTNGQSEAAGQIDIVLDESMRKRHEMTLARLENALQTDVRLGYAGKE